MVGGSRACGGEWDGGCPELLLEDSAVKGEAGASPRGGCGNAFRGEIPFHCSPLKSSPHSHTAREIKGEGRFLVPAVP